MFSHFYSLTGNNKNKIHFSSQVIIGKKGLFLCYGGWSMERATIPSLGSYTSEVYISDVKSPLGSSGERTFLSGRKLEQFLGGEA